MASQALTNALEATGFLSGGQPAAGVRLGQDALDEFRGRSLRPDAVWMSESRLTVYFKDALSTLLLLWRRRVDEIDEPPCLALPQRKNFTPHSIDVSAVGRFRIEQPSPVCTKHFSVSVIE